MKIVAAEHENIDALDPYVDQVLDALGVKRAFVSDRTLIWDFGPNQKKLNKVAELVGFEVSEQDYLLDVCIRWRNLSDTSIA